MRILQLTSDWKWTGPAEPMLRLALGQRGRGHDVWLACPEAPDPSNRSVASEARQLGIAPALSISLGRGVRLLGDRADIAALATLCDEEQIDVIHAWHTRDHVLALRASRRAKRPPAVIRSYRNAERISRAPWSRYLFGPRTAGLLCVSPETARLNASLRSGRPTRGAFGAVDVERYAPIPADDPARIETRKALGIAADQLVIGIVARVQSHRRFDLLLEAARQTFELEPRARLLVVGRGTHRERLAEEPAKRLGIDDRVIFAGYRGEDYASVLRAIDVFTFLVPGSDGTCRALLEAAACGIPAVTTRRGALPEIVVDGETGILADESAESLSRGWLRLLQDEGLRQKMGEAARRRATATFTPERFAEEVQALYDEAAD